MAFAALAVLAATAACKTYSPPTHLPEHQTARLRIVTRNVNMSDWTMGAELNVSIRDVGDECPRRNRIGSWPGDSLGKIGPIGGEDAYETRVPADRTLILLTSQSETGIGSVVSCQLAMALRPEGGRAYELRYMFKSGRCFAKILDAETGEPDAGLPIPGCDSD